ncbi:hemagglutinin [Mycoplasmopsis synoviae]|nr:hemagglutinin [Mycoplasmopsis synoviae]UBX98436.1 hemagglutinin [Mycoplasmopsis synoviae]UBX98860.1 hemagglutinin [Mycoplasmopsis synoviae]
MPKIVVKDYQPAGHGNNKDTNETANKTKLQEWFATSSNWEKLSEQLTKKLGSDKFKNVTLTNPQVSYEEVTVNTYTWKNPKVTFNIQAKPGYQLTEPTTNPKQISLTIRVLYSSQESNQNLLTIKGASPSEAPSNSSVDDANVKAKVNVYMNYTGPDIVLDQAVPAVGTANNTSLNGTSNVTGEFNTKFKKLLVNVVSRGHAESSLFQAVINYVNKFDPKFRAQFVTNSINGVTITKVQNTKELRPGTLDDLVKNDRDNVFLQQIQGDTEVVYLPVTALTNDKWLNTVLVRIPLTKFVRPLTEFQDQSATAPTQEGQTTQGQENSAGSGALGSTTGAQTPSGGSSQASGS